MADVEVNSQVLKEKAEVFIKASKDIQEIYDSALKIIESCVGRMMGKTVELILEKMFGMKERFNIISKDIAEYGEFLNEAAEAYEELESKHTALAEEQGKIF